MTINFKCNPYEGIFCFVEKEGYKLTYEGMNFYLETIETPEGEIFKSEIGNDEALYELEETILTEEEMKEISRKMQEYTGIA